MSVYCSSFKYLGLNSLTDHGLMVTHFDPDNGEMDAFLGMEPIYTESYDGTRRIDYGAKFNSVATVKITVIKRDHSDLSEKDVRKYLKWLTGARTNSYLDLIVGDNVRYSFLGRVTGIYQQKMDARTVGLSIEFSSASPWAYSALQTVEKSVRNLNVWDSFELDNPSDDLYTYVYVKTTITNKISEGILILENITTGETTELSDLGNNEVIVLDNNMIISSNNPTRIFGSNFNYVWPRLKPEDPGKPVDPEESRKGINKFQVKGKCDLLFEYVYPIKIGDCAIDTVSISDPICDEDGNIIKSTLDWEHIINTPTTLRGYGIMDDVAYKSDVQKAIDGITSVDIDWTQVKGRPYTLSGYGIIDAYTKTESENLFYEKHETYTQQQVNDAISAAVSNLQIDSNKLDRIFSDYLI